MFKKTKFLKILSLSLLFCLCFLAGRGAAALSDHASSARLTSGRISQAAENWGLSFQEEGAPPVGNATCEELKTYDAYYREDTEEKVLYLTFDCGYENGNTPRILEALKKHRAPATFFVVGNYLDTSPDLVRQMIREDHAVGNHTFHHPDMSQISGKEAFQKELEDVEKAFREITGKHWKASVQILPSAPGEIQSPQPENGSGAWLSHLLLEPGPCRLDPGRSAHPGRGPG